YRATMGVTDPDEWLRLLYPRLLGRHGLLEDNPTTDSLELRRRLTSRLEEVAARCRRNGWKELLLLDALDEAGTASSDGKNAVEVLPPSLPPGVFFLISSRPTAIADELERRGDVFRFELKPGSKENLDDATAFCLGVLRSLLTGAEEVALEGLARSLAKK